MKSKPTRLFVSVLAMYLFVEGLSALGLLFIAKVRDLRYDPNPSALSPSQKTHLTNFLKRAKGEGSDMDGALGWVMSGPEINSAGMRDNREYETMPPPGRVRVSAFGASFIYGIGLKLDETWEKRITAIAPSIEVLNYGVHAYGLDQAYLRYLKVGADYHPNIVFIGYGVEHACLHVLVFWGFYLDSGAIYTKPRFRVKDGQLVLLRNPLSTMEDYENFLHNDTKVLAELGKNDYWYQTNYNRGRFDFSPSLRLEKIIHRQLNRELIYSIFRRDGEYNVGSEAYQVTVAIVDAFYRKVLENGALPVILVLPELADQVRSRQGRIRRYTPLLDYFHSRGYRFIDTLSALQPYESRYSLNELAIQWGHFSPLANGFVAEYIVTQRKDWGVVEPSKVNQAVQAERQRLALDVPVLPNRDGATP